MFYRLIMKDDESGDKHRIVRHLLIWHFSMLTFKVI